MLNSDFCHFFDVRGSSSLFLLPSNVHEAGEFYNSKGFLSICSDTHLFIEGQTILHRIGIDFCLIGSDGGKAGFSNIGSDEAMAATPATSQV